MYRVTETPNGVMTTYASPTQGSTELSLWRVEMKEGAQGPLHVFDTEQIWTVLTGQVTIEVDDRTVDLGAGETIVIPGETPRRITAGAEFTAMVAGYGTATVGAPGDVTNRVTPAWVG
jgi:quercetin dioxygenase-like cupin family protein